MTESATVEYRQTHLAKGGTYDATIAATPFDAYMARLEGEYLREIVPSLLGERGRYLDFACGTGRITATVSPFASESVGVDVSESMLAVAREKCPGVQFSCLDIVSETPDLGQFDLATSFRFFGNAEDALRIPVLRALARLVRPGGHLVVNNHRNPRSIGSLLLAAGGHDSGMDLTHGKFRRLLGDHGFDIVSVRTIAFWVYRSRFRNDAALLEGSRAAAMERRFRHRIWAPLAPDCVIVARRR